MKYLVIQTLLKEYDIYIFYPDLVFAIAINDHTRLDICLKCLLIKFVMPNLSQIYFCLPEIFETNWVFSTKSPFEFVFFCCEFTKIIL